MAIQFAKCCNPIPGDPIIGMISKGQGMIIHTHDCPAIARTRTDPERMLDVSWDPETKKLFEVRVKLVTANQRGVLAKVAATIAEGGSNIQNVVVDPEDGGPGDLTTASIVPAGAHARGRIVARDACVVAGLNVAQAVFQELDPAVEFVAEAADRQAVSAGTTLAHVRGPAAPILTAERVALNLLQRLCGIATTTRLYVDAVAGTGVSVSDTRKTTPGLRIFEKYAVRAGGGRNHRMGLFDAVLVKDNHIVAAGGIEAALRAARAIDPSVPVQVEIDLLADLALVLDAGIEAVLVDNMTPAQVREAVQLIRAHPKGASTWIEVSGGITLDTIREYALAGVDTISVGALTHSVKALDVSLDLRAA
jgi:nicotinate-nucleotide pyrophosphorylase (carboxylating)